LGKGPSGLIGRRRMQRGGAILPCGHPGRASHGGDVVAIERPTPRVAGARLKGRWVFSLGGAHEAGAGAPARFGVRASAAPAVPSPVAHRALSWGGLGTKGGRRVNRFG
jgi:hypothetical protein